MSVVWKPATESIHHTCARLVAQQPHGRTDSQRLLSTRRPRCSVRDTVPVPRLMPVVRDAHAGLMIDVVDPVQVGVDLRAEFTNHLNLFGEHAYGDFRQAAFVIGIGI